MSESIVPASMKEAAANIKDKVLKANAEALLARMDEVIEGVGDRDIRWYPGFLKVVQKMSNLDSLPEGAKEGKLILGQEVLDDIQVIPLRTWTSRTYWPEDLDNDQKLCESPDAKQGWRYGACNKCEFGVWDDEFGKNGGVPCTKTLQYINIRADLSDIFIANFQKSQYRNGMDWEKLIKGTKTHLYKRQYDLTPEKDKNVHKLAAHFTPRSDYELTPDVEAFLAEVFAYAGESRRAQLEYHQKSMEERAEKFANGGDQAAIGHTDDDGGKIEVITSDANTSDAGSDDSVNYEV